jgi:glycosyltransferase involved in cell wall biosynthesis
LVPVYNGARYLESALNSAAHQTYRNLEILIRDDGSSDDSRAIATSFCERDKRFRLIADGEHRLGGTGNMTELLRLASGEYVKYLHQDDLLEPPCVERLARPLRFDRTVTLATSSRQRIDETGAVLPATDHVAYQLFRPHNTKVPGKDVIRFLVTTLANQLGEPSVPLFRNGVVEPERAFDLDGFTYSYMNDVALWINLLGIGDLSWHAQALSCFRTHRAQRSAQLDESVTVAGELAEYILFGLSHGYIRSDTEFIRVARALMNYLELLQAWVAEAPAAERERLAGRLRAAVDGTRRVMQHRPDHFEEAAGARPAQHTAVRMQVSERVS